ncbi:MAG: aminotransferase class V-fold PLP-dependent enzyme [Solobacterium sp.]|nr:aminotransferase class V-fold PLP-dependent enzyme [Solobacterium sp.]
MIRFDSDYIEGCIPEILEALQATNQEQCPGYGEDIHSLHAKELIQQTIGNSEADIYFLSGGTLTNVTVISSILKHHQGVITASSGHIHTHETGAIEAYGHKCLTLPSTDGKIYAKDVDAYISEHYASDVAVHTVQPGLVYISFPTESGTLYQKKELEELYSICKKHDVPLFIDGARLGYGLSAKTNDLSIQDIAQLCDIFYIGGTKVGALFGEAVVITNDKYKKDFKYHIKQHGGMLAKGRALGIQFEVLFSNNNYFNISKHSIAMAELLTEGFIKKGYSFQYEATTNQLFPILSKAKQKELEKEFAFQYWEPYDENHDVIRFVTSFMTKKENIEYLISKL